ncbi:hypothetical protein FRB99_008934 [Tulasnella sp. 403]|nr:hypothetical protein FRB99_008934 [Tulasnella sp. 403]
MEAPDMCRRLSLAHWRSVPQAIDTADGLHYLHSHEPSICHGDIKPANVLVSSMHRALLCDFGLAKAAEDVPSGMTTSRFNQLGTTRYLSPELIMANNPRRTVRSDIWAWGCLLLVQHVDRKLLTGKYPYHDISSEPTLLLKIAQNVRPAKSKDIPLPSALRKLLDSCWNPQPERRPTIEECVDILREVEAADSQHPPREDMPTSWRNMKQRLAEVSLRTVFRKPSPPACPASSSSVDSIDLPESTSNPPIPRDIQSILSLQQRLGGPQLFGVDLAQQLVYSNATQTGYIPAILRKCVKAVDAYGLEVEGIYSLQADEARLHGTVSVLLHDGDHMDLAKEGPESTTDAIVAAEILKLWLKGLPDPLLTVALYQRFIDAARMEDERQRAVDVHRCINALPETNYSALRYLMEHLYTVQRKEQSNTMSAYKLSLVFGPLLLRSEVPSGSEGDLRCARKAVEIIITNYLTFLVDYD